MGLLLECWAFNEGKVASAPEPFHSFSARVSKSSSPRRNAPQVQGRCRQLSPLKEQAQLGRAIRAWEDRSNESPTGGGAR